MSESEAKATATPPVGQDLKPQVIQPKKLPLPKIDLTLKQFLDAVEAPCAGDPRLEDTKRKVDELLKDNALVEDLNGFFQKRGEEKRNWAYEYWLNDMYMNCGVPLPINSNPGWVFPKRTFSKATDRAVYLAKLAKGLLDFKEKIERDEVEQAYAVSKKNNTKEPLCMEQFKRIFNVYRRPGKDKDAQIISDAREARERETIMVMVKSRIFIVAVKEKGQMISLQELAKILYRIQRYAEIDKAQLDHEEKISLLTSQNRREWHQSRELLIQDDANAELVAQIEEALFVICFDDLTINETDSRNSESQFRQMLVGHGPGKNGSNRWFDQTMQLICSADGVNGMCYEHSVAEGIAVVSVVSDIIKAMDKAKGEEDSKEEEGENSGVRGWLKKSMKTVKSTMSNVILSKQDSSDDVIIELRGDEEGQLPLEVAPVYWNINDEVKAKVRDAYDQLLYLTHNTDLEVYNFVDYGKDFMKSVKSSPDAFVQMALQLTYASLNGQVCFSYESASTRRFIDGRVDNIRSSHPEAAAWAAAMLDSSQTKETKRDLWRRALIKQTRVMTSNVMGEGLDIPLLGIREACLELRPQDGVALFEDEIYQECNAFKLSTSQVPIDLPLSYMGYGAVVPDGYGVSYNLQADYIIFCVASFHSCHATSSLRFAQALQRSLWMMKELLSD